jgi:hypothetical protein
VPSKLTVVLLSLLLATPAVVYWLWLVIVPARVALLCPERCVCDRAGYEVTCEKSSFTAVPILRLTDVTYLWLSDNNITLLERDSFVSLTELETLGLWKCGLRTIQLGAFNGLTNLADLTIIGNQINEIIPGTFENLSNLERLILWDNGLEHLDRDVFSGLVKLKKVGLARNKLQYLHPDTFVGLPNIKNINLHKNLRLQIPTDSNLINSHSLSHLDISRCNVSSLSVETFANVSALEWLNLQDNNLRNVDINILKALPKLSELAVYGNPLQCDCQLQEVWRWCEARNITTGDVECDTPSEVKGMWWGVLERGECIQGDIQYCGDGNPNCSYSNIDDTDTETETDTDTDTETDTEQDEDMSGFIEHYEAPIYAFAFIFGTACNVFILIIIICNKDMRTLPNMYILNLAISDIIYLTELFSEACANRISDTWLEGDFLCTFLPFCRRLSVGLSAYSVAVLSIQRYRVTVNPLQVHVPSPPTWRVTVATIFGVWIVAGLFAIPTAISGVRCEEFETVRSTTYYENVVIFELLVSCVIPLSVISFTYITTARHLVKSPRISEGTDNFQQKIRRNTARIVVGLTVVFLISYVPYHVLWTYIIFTVLRENVDGFHDIIPDDLLETNYKLKYLYLISTCFLLLNSCLNPVALFCTSSQFRQHLKRYLTCFCKTNSAPNVLELTRRN